MKLNRRYIGLPIIINQKNSRLHGRRGKIIECNELIKSYQIFISEYQPFHIHYIYLELDRHQILEKIVKDE